ATTEHHLRGVLDGDRHSRPFLGLLDGTPMSYWEIYRADLDPLALHYPAQPHDTGVHLLLGPADSRGRGLGSALLAALAAPPLRAGPAAAGHSRPFRGPLAGTPMSYWEISRPDLAPLALHYPAQPHDTGVHLLLGPADSRGRGLGSALLAALADRILRARPV